MTSKLASWAGGGRSKDITWYLPPWGGGEDLLSLCFNWYLGFVYPGWLSNSSPLKIGLPNRKVVFQPSIFRGELLVSGRVVGDFFTEKGIPWDSSSSSPLWKTQHHVGVHIFGGHLFPSASKSSSHWKFNAFEPYPYFFRRSSSLLGGDF